MHGHRAGNPDASILRQSCVPRIQDVAASAESSFESAAVDVDGANSTGSQRV